MDSNNFKEYRAEVLKLHKPRCSKDTTTLYSKEIIRRIKRNTKVDIDEDTYSKLIRRINELLIDCLFEGESITLPHKMGFITIYQYETKVTFNDGKLKRNMPIDWNKTLLAWHNNKKLESAKTLVRCLPGKVFSIKYTVPRGSYKNQYFFMFKPAKQLKQRLKEQINTNKGVPAYEYRFYNN